MKTDYSCWGERELIEELESRDAVNSRVLSEDQINAIKVLANFGEDHAEEVFGDEEIYDRENMDEVFSAVNLARAIIA